MCLIYSIKSIDAHDLIFLATCQSSSTITYTRWLLNTLIKDAKTYPALPLPTCDSSAYLFPAESMFFMQMLASPLYSDDAGVKREAWFKSPVSQLYNFI